MWWLKSEALLFQYFTLLHKQTHVIALMVTWQPAILQCVSGWFLCIFSQNLVFSLSLAWRSPAPWLWKGGHVSCRNWSRKQGKGRYKDGKAARKRGRPQGIQTDHGSTYKQNDAPKCAEMVLDGGLEGLHIHRRVSCSQQKLALPSTSSYFKFLCLCLRSSLSPVKNPKDSFEVPPVKPFLDSRQNLPHLPLCSPECIVYTRYFHRYWH